MTTTPKTLTVEECHALLNALLVKEGTKKQFRKGIRNYTMALLMLDAGLRVGEVVQLLQTDLMYGGVPVQNLLIRPEIAKTKTERTVPLSGRLRDALKEIRDHYWPAIKDPWQHYAFYQNNHWRRLTTRQVERIIRSAAMKAIGRPVHPHILRHTFGTNVERAAGMRITQELLGHKNIASTQIYTHPNEEDKKRAIDQISESIGRQIEEGAEASRLAHISDSVDTVGTDHDHR